MSHIQLDRIVCARPDGKALFPELSETISNEVVGIVGRNGCGKSTLLKAIAGHLAPASGSVTLSGRCALVSQTNYASGLSVGQALAVQNQLEILARFDAGTPREEDFETADWALPAKLEKALADCGLVDLDLARPAASLSGGERGRLKFVAALLSEPEILLLDEPTNDLDTDGRRWIANLIGAWTGPVLVASHDRALLENMDRIIELTPVSVLSVSGGWHAFSEAREESRAQAQEALEQAKAEVKAAQKARQAKAERQEQRDKQGRQSASRRGATKLEINAQKERAQATSAHTSAVSDRRAADAQSSAEQAQAAVERITPITIELPKCGLLPSHVILEAKALSCERGNRQLFEALDLTVIGPERVFLGGPNGSGKSSLVKILAGEADPSAGTLSADHGRIAVLDQHLEMLAPDETVLEAMQRHSPELDQNAAHAALAKFGFRGEWSSRKTSTLSGGEKVRLALACLFCGESPPHLLILDEPTNHLDVQAIEMLEAALRRFDGAIICSTHDEAFKANLSLTRRITLGTDEADH